MNTFYVKRHDLLPSIQATLKDSVGSAVDLTNYTVRFHMWLEGALTAKVDAEAVIVGTSTGIVRYDWQAGDTDTAGEYNAEWQATSPDNKPVTFPNYEHDLVLITGDAP